MKLRGFAFPVSSLQSILHGSEWAWLGGAVSLCFVYLLLLEVLESQSLLLFLLLFLSLLRLPQLSR